MSPTHAGRGSSPAAHAGPKGPAYVLKRFLSITLPIAALVATNAGLAGQQARDVARAPATGTAQVVGTVMTADQTPVPIRRATVVLTGDQLAERLSAVTDDNGTFAFTSLPADRYSLSASKAGYVPMNYGSKRPGGSGTPIVVA